MGPGAQKKDRSVPPQAGRPKASRRTSSNVRRTEIIINAYDLLPVSYFSYTADKLSNDDVQ